MTFYTQSGGLPLPSQICQLELHIKTLQKMSQTESFQLLQCQLLQYLFVVNNIKSDRLHFHIVCLTLFENRDFQKNRGKRKTYFASITKQNQSNTMGRFPIYWDFFIELLIISILIWVWSQKYKDVYVIELKDQRFGIV